MNFDYFLLQGGTSPCYSLLPLLVMPTQELCEYLEIIKTTEENLIPYVLDERRGGPPWSKIVEHASIILDIWRQMWLHNFENIPFLRRRNMVTLPWVDRVQLAQNSLF